MNTNSSSIFSQYQNNGVSSPITLFNRSISCGRIFPVIVRLPFEFLVTIRRMNIVRSLQPPVVGLGACDAGRPSVPFVEYSLCQRALFCVYNSIDQDFRLRFQFSCA